MLRAQLIAKGISDSAIEVIPNEVDAIVAALQMGREGDLIVIFGDNIQLVHADVNDYIQQFETGSFDAIIHDPPRFSLAGELYGEKFYREIHRVLKRRGVLFHYTGNPHQLKRGSSFMDHAAQRLRDAGFSKVTKVTKLMGVTASK